MQAVAEFVHPLQDVHKCDLCSEVLSNPVQLTECGHLFCKECLEQEMTQVCPVSKCEQKLTKQNVRPDLARKREIEGLKVRCTINPSMCTWTGPLKELKDHNEKCEARNGGGINLSVQFQSKAELELSTQKMIDSWEQKSQSLTSRSWKAFDKEDITMALLCQSVSDNLTTVTSDDTTGEESIKKLVKSTFWYYVLPVFYFLQLLKEASEDYDVTKEQELVDQHIRDFETYLDNRIRIIKEGKSVTGAVVPVDREWGSATALSESTKKWINGICIRLLKKKNIECQNVRFCDLSNIASANPTLSLQKSHHQQKTSTMHLALPSSSSSVVDLSLGGTVDLATTQTNSCCPSMANSPPYLSHSTKVNSHLLVSPPLLLQSPVVPFFSCAPTEDEDKDGQVSTTEPPWLRKVSTTEVNAILKEFVSMKLVLLDHVDIMHMIKLKFNELIPVETILSTTNDLDKRGFLYFQALLFISEQFHRLGLPLEPTIPSSFVLRHSGKQKPMMVIDLQKFLGYARENTSRNVFKLKEFYLLLFECIVLHNGRVDVRRSVCSCSPRF